MRRRWVWIAAIAAALGGTAAILLVALPGGSGARLAPPPGNALSVTGEVAPARLLFGDRVEARLLLTIDRTRVDPDTVDVAAFFRPFRRVGPIEIERTPLGDTVILEYRYPLQCVDRACAPRGPDAAIELPVGVIRYASRDGVIGSLPLTWPSLSVATRLSPQAAGDISARPVAIELDGAASNLPPVTYAVAPGLLGWLLVGAAASLVLVLGAVIAWRLRVRGTPGETARALTEPRLGPLDAALASVERTLAASDPDERRAALDALGLELGRGGSDELAREARRLAWSQAGPRVTDVEGLLARVRQALEDAA